MTERQKWKDAIFINAEKQRDGNTQGVQNKGAN